MHTYIYIHRHTHRYMYILTDSKTEDEDDEKKSNEIKFIHQHTAQGTNIVLDKRGHDVTDITIDSDAVHIEMCNWKDYYYFEDYDRMKTRVEKISVP